MSTELCYLSAADALKRFKNRSLSPVELMQAVIDRCEQVNGPINALTETYFDQALELARKSEARYILGKPKPLDGIPLAVKDEFRVQGTRRTSSSLVFKDRLDQETDVIIDRLLRAGAICHAKTTTPEFCILGSCHSRLWGITGNPWNLDFTPGGSSGGSGAVLAAGMTTLATGTDIGGSIRIPAAQCGVVGYKPPYGRNPEIPVFNLDFYSHSGPMTRSVTDAAMMQNLMSGPHNQDIASLRNLVKIDTEKNLGDLKGWRIACSMDLGFMEIDADVVANTHAAMDIFRDLGATVEEVDLGWTDEIIGAVHAYWAHTWVSAFSHLLEEHRDQLCEYTRYFIENSARYTVEDFHHSLEVAVNLYNGFGPMMDKYDLFLCPTLGTNRIPADFSWPSTGVVINGKAVDMAEEYWSLTYPFNMLSRCPVLSLPSGLADNGVPTAIQLVGQTFDDIRVFEGAKAYQAAAPGVFQWQLDQNIPLGGKDHAHGLQS